MDQELRHFLLRGGVGLLVAAGRCVDPTGKRRQEASTSWYWSWAKRPKVLIALATSG